MYVYILFFFFQINKHGVDYVECSKDNNLKKIFGDKKIKVFEIPKHLDKFINVK